MKNLKYAIMALAGIFLFSACKDDELPGNPVIDYNNNVNTAFFGDSLPFTVKASDVDVPLSTLKAQLYYGEQKVSETVIRTKVSGQDYSGKIYLPYFANVPDGTATLKFVLQNIHFTKSEKEVEVPITHPDFPYLTIVTTDGDSYKMTRTAQYQYAYTGKLPQKLKAYVKTPKMGENGNELSFGYADNAVTVGAESAIPFSNARAGRYTVALNTFSFEASPFVVLKINGTELEGIDDNNAKIDMTLTKGQTLTLEGFPNYEDWWIDPDFFTQNEDGTLTFAAMNGDYRIIANSELQYLRVQVLKGGSPATLNADGSGAPWVIGEKVGKPSVSGNEVGWNTDNAICMAPIADKVYQMTLVAGKTVAVDAINFKFFSEMGWGGGFSHSNLTSTSDLVLVGDGTSHDDGNLYLADGKSFDPNGIYVFTLDMTGGFKKAVLSVKKTGTQAFVEKKIYLNDNKMNTTDNSMYALSMNLTQNQTLTIRGISDLPDWYADPDYFDFNGDAGTLKFRPVNGTYKIVFNRDKKVIGAIRMNGNDEATLGSTGSGAIWLMGWGVGMPSQDNQFGFNPGAAYCMAEVSPKVYQFTGMTGPETGSSVGQRIRADYLSFKFFYQDGWGDEFSGDNALTLTDNAKKLLKMTDGGNFELAGGSLEMGATYVITINLSNGVKKGTIDLAKK